MIETSQLQTLVAVARASSFSKAAEELSVTQSAISQSIKNLENKLEVRLFKRSGKKVVLTAEGEKLFSLANDFLMQLDETLDEIKHDKESMSGKIRIGTLTGIGKSWLAPELLDFGKANPEISLNIHMGFQEDLVKEFSNYRLDLLVLPEEALPSLGEKVLLSEERSTLVFAKNNEFKIDRNITLEKLSGTPTVLFQSDDPLFFRWCREKFGQFPKKLNPRYIINSHGNMLQAVLAGLGVAVIPSHVLSRSVYRDKVATLGKEFEVTNGRFYIVFHKGADELVRIKSLMNRLLSRPNPLADFF